jgi:hypothetical protein
VERNALDATDAGEASISTRSGLGGCASVHGKARSWPAQGRKRRDPHSLASHGAEGAFAYEAGGTGPAVSRDGGVSWERAREGLDRLYYWWPSLPTRPTPSGCTSLRHRGRATAPTGPSSSAIPRTRESGRCASSVTKPTLVSSKSPVIAAALAWEHPQSEIASLWTQSACRPDAPNALHHCSAKSLQRLISAQAGAAAGRTHEHDHSSWRCRG